MGDRQGDARIYVVSVLFLACTIGGGIFLLLYILAPDSESVAWYHIAGMTLIAIPWLFWFLTYMYRCIRPEVVNNAELDQHHRQNSHICNISTKGSPKSVVTSPHGMKSSENSPVSGERRVRFGAVVEVEEGFSDCGGGGQEDHHWKDDVEELQHHEHDIPSLVIV